MEGEPCCTAIGRPSLSTCQVEGQDLYKSPVGLPAALGSRSSWSVASVNCSGFWEIRPWGRRRGLGQGSVRRCSRRDGAQEVLQAGCRRPLKPLCGSKVALLRPQCLAPRVIARCNAGTVDVFHRVAGQPALTSFAHR